MASTLNNNTEVLQELLSKINDLPDESNGVELPPLDNEGTAFDLLAGKELINSSGEKVTGTIETKTSSDLTVSGATVTVPKGYYASQATKSVATATQATPSVSIDSAGKITATATQTAGYVSAGTKTGTKQLTTQAAKTITPSTSSQTAVASGVYTTGAVTVAAMPTATQATPSISVSNAGLITASSTQTAGYVSAGTKTGTKQLTVQAAQTITPSTSNKTIASGRYLTGTQTIKGDANLKAANIAKGVSIFGITGTHEGGEDISAETAEYTAQLDELEDAIDSLPNAGGGGGSVETCTVTAGGYGLEGIVTYSDGTQVVERDGYALYEPGGTITVAKNSVLFFEEMAGGNSLSVTGEATIIYASSGGWNVLKITGDCTLKQGIDF